MKMIQSSELESEKFAALGGGAVDFPVGRLGALIVFFQHYHDMDIALSNWSERCSRTNPAKFFLFIVYDDTTVDIVNSFFCSRTKLF